MRAQILILVIYATAEHYGAEVKPVVTFRPNWKTIFQSESLTMFCDVKALKNDRYYWSKDGTLLPDHQQTITMESASAEDTGSYQCWTKPQNLKSDPVRLDVVGRTLILQTPPVIYTGEPLTLRCHSYPGYKSTNTTFFKNKTVIHFSVNDTEMRFARVDLNVTGTYSCSQQILWNGSYATVHAETIVSVQDKKPKMVDPKKNSSYNQVDSQEERPQGPSLGGISPRILLVVPVLLISAALLIFTCRHKLRIKGHHQQHTITETERKDSPDEDNLCYTYIQTDHLPRETEKKGSPDEDNLCYTYIRTEHLLRALPAQKPDDHDYETIYSMVTVPCAVYTKKEGTLQ